MYTCGNHKHVISELLLVYNVVCNVTFRVIFYTNGGQPYMIIELDMSSDTPIYVQLRNQIVKGIGKGELKANEKLPTVRQLAADAGVNTMTVNKTYQILKNEGFIRTDRRLGAFVADNIDMKEDFREKLESELELLSAEACITGMDKETFLNMCSEVYSRMNPCTA